MKGFRFSILLTILVAAVYAILMFFFTPHATLLGARLAGKQFDNSDAAYVSSVQGIQFLSGSGALMSLIALILVLAIWWPHARVWLKMSLAALVGMVAFTPYETRAYYDKTDFTEAYTILPNESAFWIPDVGANRDNQTQFETEDYLRANKIAVKRFIVPHQKLSGSGSFFDFYVPAGRLIIVDRTPFSREWVAQSHRGTSNKDESFPCQSREGINIAVGVSIGASVLEADAARYLYRFGVLSPGGDRSDPRVIFTSVYYSRRLSEVMDDVGRKKVQTLVCDEITARSFDEANTDAVKIMDSVKKKATDYFATVGITLDFVGWADTFTFDKDIQAAVNRRYVASQDQAIAAALAPYASVIQALAAADALRGFGQKTDGKLPTTIVGLPPQVGELMQGLMQSADKAPKPPAAR